MNKTDYDKSTQLWLDRLVCGELDEPTRAGLLAWLDAEPLRWRSCAMAFLEAQTWNESLSATPALADQVDVRSALRQPPRRQNWASTWAVLAPLVLAAFVLGGLARGWISPTGETAVVKKEDRAQEPVGPVMASVSLQPIGGGTVGATIQIPVVPVPKDSAAGDDPLRPISDYERQKWERRGYQLTKERRFLPARLPDGKKVVVPVDQVKASYVGSKVS